MNYTAINAKGEVIGRYYTAEMAEAAIKCWDAFHAEEMKEFEITLDSTVYRYIGKGRQLAGVSAISREINRINNRGGQFKVHKNQSADGGWILTCKDESGRTVSIWGIVN